MTLALTDLPANIAKRTTVSQLTGCWRCSINHDKDGYSRISGTGAHRVVYTLLVGEIPPGLVIDHVAKRGCRYRDCINPAHLEPVTIRINTLRGHSFAAVNAAKDRCDHGHEFDLFNTHYWRGRRICRKCNAAAVRRYDRRQRARQDIAAAA